MHDLLESMTHNNVDIVTGVDDGVGLFDSICCCWRWCILASSIFAFSWIPLRRICSSVVKPRRILLVIDAVRPRYGGGGVGVGILFWFEWQKCNS